MARRICFVAGDVRKRLRTSLAAYQVYYRYIAGHGVLCCRSAFLGRTCDVVGLTAAISVAGPRQRIGPATPEWQTCDTVGIIAAISVAGHGLQCSRSAFLGRTCDTICITAAISVAGPQQRIGPATPEGETSDARWKASITRRENLRH